MERRHSNIFQIINARIGDELIFNYSPDTPYYPTLSLRDKDLDPVKIGIEPFADDGNNLYYRLVLDQTNNITESKQYFIARLEDNETEGFDFVQWVIYVNDDKNMADYISRIQGLAGKNIRKFSFVYQSGILTQFQVKIYETSELLENAINNVSDDFIAHYTYDLTYDSQYRITNIEVTKND